MLKSLSSFKGVLCVKAADWSYEHSDGTLKQRRKPTVRTLTSISVRGVAILQINESSFDFKVTIDDRRNNSAAGLLQSKQVRNDLMMTIQSTVDNKR